MKKERRLNIILDNARIHTSKVVEITCDILNINLVFLPPYCPLNPIHKSFTNIISNSHCNLINIKKIRKKNKKKHLL